MRAILLSAVCTATLLNFSAVAQAPAKDLDGEYGDIFDSLQAQEATLTDDQKFEKIKSDFGDGGQHFINCISISPSRVKACSDVCEPFKELIVEDYYPAISFTYSDISKYGTNGIFGACQKTPNDFPSISFVLDAPQRLPEVVKNKEDTFNLGEIYSAGEIADKAYEYFKISADLGNDKGQYRYALSLKERGDDKNSFIYFNKSAEQGNLDAKKMLKLHFDYDFVSKTRPQSSIQRATVSQEIPSVMAKDYWVKVEQADVYDASDNVIGTLSHSSSVTTYGEKNGLGKIDLTHEKWVKLTDLSSTKPAIQITKPTAIVSDRGGSEIVAPIVERRLFVPSDTKASYYLTEVSSLGGNLSIVTKRLGPIGQSFSKREIDCSANMFRYLGDGETLEEMNSAYDVKSMRHAKKGDVNTKISYDIIQDVCSSNRDQSNSKQSLKDSFELHLYVKGSSLNYRDAPNGNKLGSLSFATKVTAYGRDGKWLRISKADQPERWVHGDYLSENKPVERARNSKGNTINSLGFTEVGDGGRYGISRSLTSLKSKCSYRQMAQFSVGEYDSGGCRYVVSIIKKDRNHPYVTNLTSYMNSSNWP